MATASVAKSVEHWSRDPGWPEVLELHFSQLVQVDTLIYDSLKNLCVDNECKCHIIIIFNAVYPTGLYSSLLTALNFV